MALMPPESNSIARASKEAEDALASLSVKSLNTLGEADTAETTTQECNNEIERLRIWIDEHDVRSGSLDQKLSEESRLRDRILSLLKYLYAFAITLHQAKIVEITSEHANRGTCSCMPLPKPVEEHAETNEKETVDRSSLSLETNVTLPDGLPDWLWTQIHDTITILFELCPSFPGPAPLDRSKQATHLNTAQHDLRTELCHVRAQFRNASDSLIYRLGKANWERRQSLAAIQLAHSCEADQLIPTKPILENEVLELSGSDVDGSAVDIRESSVACPHGAESSSASVSVFGSQTPYATSTASDIALSAFDTHFTTPSEHSEDHFELPKRTENPGVRYKVPHPPRPNECLTGETFICPFCAQIMTGMKSKSEWRRHVLNDLQPYMCTYPKCTLAAKTYRDKDLWWCHEIEQHRAQYCWVCMLCEQQGQNSSLATSALFEEHLSSDHTIDLTSLQVQNIKDACRQEVGRDLPQNVCPLCQIKVPTDGKPGTDAVEKAVKKHVSDHLERLALSVVQPKGHLELSEHDSKLFQDDSDAEEDLRSEIESVESRHTSHSRISRKQMSRDTVQQFIADQLQVATNSNAISIENAGTPDDTSPPASPLDDGHLSQRNGIRVAARRFPMFVGMPPANEHFYCRQSLLTHIHEILRTPGSICSAHGAGGVGKTVAAIQYCHQRISEYDAIFWLQADTASGLFDSYLQMVTALGIVENPADHDHVVAKGKGWLAETDKRWLLVFDNVIFWEDISRYMPSDVTRTNGSVIILTQKESLAPSGRSSIKLRVPPLNRNDGADMLLRYLRRDPTVDPERRLATEISAFVGGIPVAIAHVAGYVSFSGYSLEELIETFREWRLRTGAATDAADDLPTAFREESFSYELMLQLVWEVTLRELSKDARDVLNIMAYLNCAAIPKTMLWVVHENPILQVLDSRERIRTRRTIDSLTRRRLVHDADGSYSLHRSLQRGLRENLTQDQTKQQMVFDQAVALLHEAFPGRNIYQQPRPDKWAEYQKLLPHLHALHDVYRRSKRRIKGSLDFVQLLLDAGIDQFERGITQDGTMLLNTAEIALDDCVEPSSEVHQALKAKLHTVIALTYDDAGISKREEALSRRRQALQLHKKMCKDPKTMSVEEEIHIYNSEMDYVISLLSCDRYEEAEPIIERCLAKYKEWGSEDEFPFEYAKYYHKIGFVRMYQGRFDEAMASAERGASLMEQTGYSIFASRFRFDQACIVLQSGDLEQALQLHLEIHDYRIESVGSASELSLHSMYAIGAIKELMGHNSEALTWFQRILETRRSITSWPEEAWARAQYHLASVLCAQGKTGEADELHARAQEVLQRLLPLSKRPKELADVLDEAILLDHMCPGAHRFTGRGLLEYFLRKTESSSTTRDIRHQGTPSTSGNHAVDSQYRNADSLPSPPSATHSPPANDHYSMSCKSIIAQSENASPSSGFEQQKAEVRAELDLSQEPCRPFLPDSNSATLTSSTTFNAQCDPSIDDNFNSVQNRDFYAKFCYPPLKRDRHEIRLLEVDVEAEPHYRRTVRMIPCIDLSMLPTYSALSYHCGAHQETEPIIVDGHSFNAFKNLVRAMDQAIVFWKRRFPDRPLHLWVDQICINQSDPEERGRQVKFMRQIYQNAENVIIAPLYKIQTIDSLEGWQRVNEYPNQLTSRLDAPSNLFEDWLRAEDSGRWLRRYFPGLKEAGRPEYDLYSPLQDEKAISSPWSSARSWLSFSPRAEDYWNHQPLRAILERDMWTSDSRPDSLNYTKTRKVELVPFMILWLCIREIIHSQWWRRAWIFQEFIVASKAWFLLDRYDVRWDRLLRLFNTLPPQYFGHFIMPARYVKHNPPSRNWGPHFQRLVENFIGTASLLNSEREQTQWAAVSDLLNKKRDWRGEEKLSVLLAHSCSCEATDPRDKIFAFIGLASPLYNIIPNYHNSINRVLIATARSLIETEDSLDILALSSLERPITRDALPTWVPDYASQRTAGLDQTFLASIGITPGHDASRDTVVQARFLTRGDDNFVSILGTEGIYIGTLAGAFPDNDETERWRIFNFASIPAVQADSVVTKCNARRSDEVWLFNGARIPYVVRRVDAWYSLIGPAMLRLKDPAERWTDSPIMFGRFMTGPLEGSPPSQDILVI